MRINEKTRILLTGAAGGLGSAIASGLAAKGARIALLDHNAAALDTVAQSLLEHDNEIITIEADLSDSVDISRAVQVVNQQFSGVDMLINSAGLMSFKPFTAQSTQDVERMFRVNVLAPMQLVHDLLPGMLDQGSGQVVNVGSTFGSLGFAYFSSYSASKYALRGFSEALRREVQGSGVKVTYVAPRAIKTALNSPEVYAMAAKVKMNMDEPGEISAKIIYAIENDRKDVYFGFPESLFARLNGIVPRLIDMGLRSQNRAMAEYAGDQALSSQGRS